MKRSKKELVMANNDERMTAQALDEKRQTSKARMMEIVERAYDNKMITKEHSHGEIVYRIRIPHENLATYAMVVDHDA